MPNSPEIEPVLFRQFFQVAELEARYSLFGQNGVVNGISNSHANYLAAGGLGIMLGDGRLNYGGEHILEAYYKYAVTANIHLSGDFRCVDNPG